MLRNRVFFGSGQWNWVLYLKCPKQTLKIEYGMTDTKEEALLKLKEARIRFRTAEQLAKLREFKPVSKFDYVVGYQEQGVDKEQVFNDAVSAVDFQEAVNGELTMVERSH